MPFWVMIHLKQWHIWFTPPSVTESLGVIFNNYMIFLRKIVALNQLIHVSS